MGEDPPGSTVVHLPGTGSRLIGGGSQVEISQEEVQQVVLEGFFPTCGLGQRPLQQSAGFREFGLPYASDPAVTHHLAAFLWDHRTAGRTDEEIQQQDDLTLARPDWVLFNGGVIKSAVEPADRRRDFQMVRRTQWIVG